MKYLLKNYDKTYYPEKIISSGKAVYIERNYHMINKSSICVVYFNSNYKPQHKNSANRNLSNIEAKSGTEIAYKYAKKKGKIIINVFN